MFECRVCSYRDKDVSFVSQIELLLGAKIKQIVAKDGDFVAFIENVPECDYTYEELYFMLGNCVKPKGYVWLNSIEMFETGTGKCQYWHVYIPEKFK